MYLLLKFSQIHFNLGAFLFVINSSVALRLFNCDNFFLFCSELSFPLHPSCVDNCPSSLLYFERSFSVLISTTGTLDLNIFDVSLSICIFFSGTVGADLLCPPLANETSLVSQIALFLAYSLLVVTRVTVLLQDIPFCLTSKTFYFFFGHTIKSFANSSALSEDCFSEGFIHL